MLCLRGLRLDLRLQLKPAAFRAEYVKYSTYSARHGPSLREYAEDWQLRLLNAPNHRDNWGLVQLISLSDDEQLRDWLVGAAR